MCYESSVISWRSIVPAGLFPLLMTGVAFSAPIPVDYSGSCSALGYVFLARMPSTVEALQAALDERAVTAEATILFSQAPEPTGLSEPRHLFGLGPSRR